MSSFLNSPRVTATKRENREPSRRKRTSSFPSRLHPSPTPPPPFPCASSLRANERMRGRESVLGYGSGYSYSYGHGNGHGRRAFNFVPKFSKVVCCGCRSVVQEEARDREDRRGREFPRPRHKSLSPGLLGVNARGIYFGDVCNFAPSDLLPRLLLSLPAFILLLRSFPTRHSLPCACNLVSLSGCSQRLLRRDLHVDFRV